MAQPKGLSFPQEEQRLPWLSMLLDGYAIADEGVGEALRREERQGRKLACGRGCASCCRTHTTIPVYPLELVGLYWYATERVHGAARAQLKAQLRHHDKEGACPFLVDDACAVHPMRPMACRQFNVLGTACAEGEDAYYTRRQDVLTPLKSYTDKAFHAMLPFYGITDKAKRRQAVKAGALHAMARVMKDCDWAKLAQRMNEYDRLHGVTDASA